MEVWADAVVPGVEKEEEREIRGLAESAVFDPKRECDVLLEPILEAKKEILDKKPYLS